MTLASVAARFVLVFSCALMTATPAMAGRLQCVPFAREVSGIDIRGNAKTWWSQAEGRYDRGRTPKVGAVLAFSATGKMRYGHVAMVSRIVSDREVLLTHANWSRPGGIERDVRAVDVSEAGDWSKVRVWFASLHDLGRTAYPINGFIYADGAPAADIVAAPVADTAPVLIAQAPTEHPGLLNPIGVIAI